MWATKVQNQSPTEPLQSQSAGDALLDAALQLFLNELKGLWDVAKFSGKHYTKIYNGKEFAIRCIAGWSFGSWFEIAISYDHVVIFRTGRQKSPDIAEQVAEAFIQTFN